MARPVVGVDWGTSNLRAFLFDADGAVSETRERPAGISKIANGAFEAALTEAIDGWAPTGADIVMCGMIGARQGWAEAPYALCPASCADWAGNVRRLETAIGPATIAPGLNVAAPDRPADVMRGEETQIFGALGDHEDALVVAPGTHSKWATVAGGRIVSFRTFMTGELHALLLGHSILGRLADGREHDADAFARGLELSFADPALSATLFSARAEALMERLPPAGVSSYVSGLLIGAEIGANRDRLANPIVVIASDALAGLYETALRRAGATSVRLVDGERAAAAGLWRLHSILRRPG